VPSRTGAILQDLAKSASQPLDAAAPAAALASSANRPNVEVLELLAARCR
jgi:hypothetical protein